MGINASQFTQVMALIGGGAKKDGGKGMIGGAEKLFYAGAQYGNKLGLEGKELPTIDSVSLPKLFEK